MDNKQGTFVGDGNLALFQQCWLPEGEPRAVLAVVHGIGEHSGRYHNLVDYFVPKGIAVYGFDHRGHGRSPGKRGHINDFGEFRADVAAFLKHVAQQQPNRPTILLGHSMGGLIVLNYALHHPDGYNGVIASAPHLGQPGISPVIIKISQLLSRFVPAFSINVGLDATGISRDSAAVEAYQADSLVHGLASARMGTELADAVDWTQAHAAEFKVPLLLIHGDADRLTDPQASERFFNNVKLADKKLVIYEGGFHESHNDTHRAQVMADFEQWIENHI